MTIAEIVPAGIARFGSFRSPDIETPASKPVTAGKKMPNSTMNGAASAMGWSSGAAGANS